MMTDVGQVNPIAMNQHDCQGQQVQVVLVSMPFAPLLQPSIGLGLLKAALTSQHISSKVLYFTLKFAGLIGTNPYLFISHGHPATYDLVGEWIFSSALFDTDCLDMEGYIENVLRERSPAHKKQCIPEPLSENFVQNILTIRSKVAAFLEDCLQEVLRYRPQVVAFTSVFQQHVAALSLAKRIKAQAPDTLILLGGANCEGVMGVEVIRQFPFVDATMSGEGDMSFPEIVQRYLQNKPYSDLQGVYTRNNIHSFLRQLHYPNTPSVTDMDSLPLPDYDDFFEQLEVYHHQLDQRYRPRLLFETSRGCWWGEKHHCTFCGLNGTTMSYRSKSAERALDELLYLTQKYPNCPVSVVDNILNMQYFKDFIPELAARQLDLELFYEVKANLRKEQVRLLRDAGITLIQPGIESLSSSVLALMRKGVGALQNIQLLKWCKELGIEPLWNILWGFPGEFPTEYDRMTRLIPWLTHLQPPRSVATVRLDRFSPNFDHPEQFGFVNVEPYPSYRYIYPLAPEAVTNLAYYFTFEYQEPQDVHRYTQPLAEQIAAWQFVYETSDLFSVDKETRLLVWDLRPSAQQPLHILTGLQRVLYLACDRIHTLNQLPSLAKEYSNRIATRQDVEDLLHPLLESGLMLRDEDSYLSLAIPLGDYSPKHAVLKRFQEVVKSLGQVSAGSVIIPVHHTQEITDGSRQS
jgi:ribosomal peptide maturation radical SAM protein 1